MDPSNQLSNFLNLLNSQNPYQLGSSNCPVNNQYPYQYDPRSPTSQLEDPNLEEHQVDDRKKRRKWSPTEDVVLISAWLNTSKDPIVANERKAAAFWKCIANYFAASPKLAGMQPREPNHCKQRWSKINEGVCKFVGCYEAATKQRSSGQNENDVVKLAHKFFFNDYNVKFTLERAWRELRNDQRWCGSSTKRKCADQSSTAIPGGIGDDEPRPMRVTAAKAKKEMSGTKPTSVEEGKTLYEFQCMWEIKQKDFSLKEKLSKAKFFASLVAKTEPLTETELALKEKLINDMLASE